MIATTDGGRTWSDIAAWKDGTASYGGISSANGSSFHNTGSPVTFVSPSGKNENVTGLSTPSTTIFSLAANGSFVRDEAGPPFVMSGLPHVHGFRDGAGGASMWLRDGSMLLTAVTSGIGERSAYLSVVALHSRDGGFTWTYAGVVASADEVPYAHEGPSENALAYLSNGSIICVMRVQGENGHHSPYVSKVSADGGRSWAHLRSLRAWPGEALAPGCVLPRMLNLDGSLVLAGGRPSPSSHDILLWLNAAGDGEAWRPYSVSYWHDRLVSNQSWIWPGHLVNRSWPRYDTSYTSLVRTGAASAYLVYGTYSSGFAMPVQLAP